MGWAARNRLSTTVGGVSDGQTVRRWSDAGFGGPRWQPVTSLVTRYRIAALRAPGSPEALALFAELKTAVKRTLRS